MEAAICVLCPWGLDSGLLSQAVSLSDGIPVRVLVPEADAEAAAKYGAGYIHLLNEIPSDECDLARYLTDRILEWKCNIVLAPATVQMRNVMPMLAWHLKAGLTADCTALSISDGTLLQTRPAFGNSLMATIRSLSSIQMATVRTGTFRCTEHPCDAPVFIREDFSSNNTSVCLTAFKPFHDDVPVSQANIVIAGGAGIGSKAGFQKLEKLAKHLGASVAASRNAVDAGYAPYRLQVGMTGITVSPKLYIAVGISGAVQHLAGMSGSEKVIAINSDPKAPIFDYANFGIVSDWEAVIDQLLEELL